MRLRRCAVDNLVRWWDRPRIKAKQGDLAKIKGSDRTIACPKCNDAPVVYNGNYLCDNWNYPPGPGDCDWALEHPVTTKAGRQICDLLGIDYG